MNDMRKLINLMEGAGPYSGAEDISRLEEIRDQLEYYWNELDQFEESFQDYGKEIIDPKRYLEQALTALDHSINNLKDMYGA